MSYRNDLFKLKNEQFRKLAEEMTQEGWTVLLMHDNVGMWQWLNFAIPDNPNVFYLDYDSIRGTGFSVEGKHHFAYGTSDMQRTALPVIKYDIKSMLKLVAEFNNRLPMENRYKDMDEFLEINAFQYSKERFEKGICEVLRPKK